MLAAMNGNKSAIERAFEMARSGDFETIPGIRAQLKQEGYYGDQICGPVLFKQLRALIIDARGMRLPKDPEGENVPPT
jgi:hypothetical protein